MKKLTSVLWIPMLFLLHLLVRIFFTPEVETPKVQEPNYIVKQAYAMSSND